MSAADQVSRELQTVAKELTARLELIAGQRVAFTLLVWTPGRANYISSADRAEVAAQLRDLLAHWESGMPDVPAHKVD